MNAKLVGCSTSYTKTKTSYTKNYDYYTYYWNLSTSDWDFAVLKNYNIYEGFGGNDYGTPPVFFELITLIPKGVSSITLNVPTDTPSFQTINWTITDTQFSTQEFSDAWDLNEHYKAYIELYKYN